MPVFTHTMPGDGGVCAVMVEVLLEVAVLAAGVDEAVFEPVLVAGLLGAAGEVAGFEVVVVVAGFEAAVVAAGFEVVVAVLLVEVDLPAAVEEEVPVAGLVDFEVFDLEVLLVVLELVGDPLPVLCANSAPEPTVPMSRAPSTREAISFLALPFILSP